MKNQLIYLMVVGVFFAACGNSKKDQAQDKPKKEVNADSLALAQSAEKLALEREKLKVEEEKLALEKEKLEQSKRAQVVGEAVRNSVFHEYQRVVVVNKTYFHNGPDAGTQRKAYLVAGDQFYVGKIKANYVYTDFTNEANGKTTSGWILMDDIAPFY
ncbi:MAG: hypothetical protein ACKOZY_03815 [Flavobacteriales bacterium]